MVPLLPADLSLTSDSISLRPLLDAFLISIQALMSRCPVTTDDEANEESQDYISNGYKFVRDFTHLLSLDKVNARLDALLVELSFCANFRPILMKVLPFLKIYLILVRDHLAVHNNWTKSLFKLVFVLCTVMQTLSQQGFCQPPEGDDNEGGEVEVDNAGVGIGDGSGNNDVSKEIDDESQIEGLQGDDVENKEREGKHDNEDAIEMNDDFGSALEDIPDATSENDMESDADNEPELDETLENLDDLDTTAVDEKMWGDEKGPDPRDSEDHTNQERSKKQDDSSEVVGKESKEQTQSNEKQPEESGESELEGKDESAAEGNEDDESNDPNVSGAPMNEVPDANTLDLPDDIDVGGDDVDMNDGSVVDDTGMEQDDDGMREENQLADDAVMDDDQVPDNALESQESACDVNDNEMKESEQADDEASRDEVIAPPDMSEGAGMTESTEPSHNEPRDNISTGELGMSATGRQGPASSPDHERVAEDNR